LGEKKTTGLVIFKKPGFFSNPASNTVPEPGIGNKPGGIREEGHVGLGPAYGNCFVIVTDQLLMLLLLKGREEGGRGEIEGCGLHGGDLTQVATESAAGADQLMVLKGRGGVVGAVAGGMK
jgi:hypothetical protein